MCGIRRFYFMRAKLEISVEAFFARTEDQPYCKLPKKFEFKTEETLNIKFQDTEQMSKYMTSLAYSPVCFQLFQR